MPAGVVGPLSSLEAPSIRTGKARCREPWARSSSPAWPTTPCCSRAHPPSLASALPAEITSSLRRPPLERSAYSTCTSVGPRRRRPCFANIIAHFEPGQDECAHDAGNVRWPSASRTDIARRVGDRRRLGTRQWLPAVQRSSILRRKESLLRERPSTASWMSCSSRRVNWSGEQAENRWARTRACRAGALRPCPAARHDRRRA